MEVLFTSHNQTVSELEEVFQKLSLKLEEANSHAVRNKKEDIAVMTESELTQVLAGKNIGYKKRELFSQIGYLRINLFSEYYERVLRAESEGDYNRAVGLMNEYIKKVTTPFISKKKQSKLLNKIKRFFAVKIDPDPVETMKDWNDCYEMWVKKDGIKNSWSASERLENYKKTKQIFITLYHISFSYRNFPPVSREPAH